MREQLDG